MNSSFSEVKYLKFNDVTSRYFVTKEQICGSQTNCEFLIDITQIFGD